MMMIRHLLRTAVSMALLLSPSVALAGPKDNAHVSLYRAAPGQQVALLKWLAEQDRAASAAGVGVSQIYVHTQGDSWDYLVISPETTKAQDDAVDAAAKRMGLSNGPRASIDFRKTVGSHTDTMTMGPMTIAEYLAMIGEK